MGEVVLTTPTERAIAARPAGSEYGHLLGGTAVGCKKERVIEKTGEVGLPAIDLVWTP